MQTNYFICEKWLAVEKGSGEVRDNRSFDRRCSRRNFGVDRSNVERGERGRTSRSETHPLEKRLSLDGRQSSVVFHLRLSSTIGETLYANATLHVLFRSLADDSADEHRLLQFERSRSNG